MILLIGLIIVLFVIVHIIDDKGTHYGCDMDCKRCPFPECNPKEKAWIRWYMNK